MSVYVGILILGGLFRYTAWFPACGIAASFNPSLHRNELSTSICSHMAAHGRLSKLMFRPEDHA